MPLNSPSPNKIGYTALIYLITLAVFLVLFILRSVDDNRLTSWQWAFNGINVSGIFIILILGIITAYVLSKFSSIERNPVISLFIFSFLVSTLFWKEPEVIVDISRYFTQAKHLSEYGINYFIDEWGREIHAWTDLPLIPFMYGLIFKYFGENRIYIQIFTTSLFSLTVITTFLIGKTLWNENVGFHAGLLLMGIPYLNTQVPLMLVDIPTMFFLTFSVFSFIKALSRGGIWIIISSIAVFLAFFSKYSTWLMLSVLTVVLLVYLLDKKEVQETQQRRHYIYRSFFVSLLFTIFAAVVIFFEYNLIKEQLDILLSYQKPGLKRWGESFVSTYFFQIHPLITISAIFSFFLALKKRDLKYVIICWLTLLMMFLWIKRIRYILPTFPMLALMASYGLQQIKDSDIRRFLSFSIVCSSLVIGIFLFLPFLQKMSPANIMNAGLYLNSLNTQDIEIITLYPKSSAANPAVSVPALDIYTDKNIYYDYVRPELPETFKTSPLRFTWKYKNPAYYKKEPKTRMPIVLITSDTNAELPELIKEKLAHYNKTEEFTESTGIFRYSPVVMVFEP